MTTRQKIEWLVYFLAIVFSLAAVGLAALSSSFEIDTRVVYQGF
jgi:hypothetical protein